MFGKYCGAAIDEAVLEFSKFVGECPPCAVEAAPQPAHAGPREAKDLPVLVDPLGCGDHPLGEAYTCCMPEADAAGRPDFGPGLFSPCVICTVRSASIVELPCGHVNVCADCYVDYSTNKRCLQCRQLSTARVDVSPFLDAASGRPNACNICKSALASVVIIPCVHMCFCYRCLPQSFVGCPTCGKRVERICEIHWSSASTTPSLPASVRALPPGGRDGLAAATEDIDLEIFRLEQQLRNLRSCSSQASSRPATRRATELPRDTAPLAFYGGRARESPPISRSGRPPPEAPPRFHDGGAAPEAPPTFYGGRAPPEAPPTSSSGRPPPEAPPRCRAGGAPPEAPPTVHGLNAPPEFTTAAAATASGASTAAGTGMGPGSLAASESRSKASWGIPLPLPGVPPPNLGNASDFDFGSFFRSRLG